MSKLFKKMCFDVHLGFEAIQRYAYPELLLLHLM